MKWKTARPARTNRLFHEFQFKPLHRYKFHSDPILALLLITAMNICIIYLWQSCDSCQLSRFSPGHSPSRAGAESVVFSRSGCLKLFRPKATCDSNGLGPRDSPRWALLLSSWPFLLMGLPMIQIHCDI